MSEPDSVSPAEITNGQSSHSTLFIPTSYRAGHAKARPKDRALADAYVRNTTIGDPELDPVIEECSSLLRPSDVFRFVRAGIEQDAEVLSRAPSSLREFFHEVDNTRPPWLDYELFRPASRAVYKNANLVLGGFVSGALVEGFSTLIAKSFRITGRVGSDNTKRRLGHNTRHLLEIFYPDGMLRQNDGWKMTLRIRVIHAKVRYLLNHSDDWDAEAWGCPLSAAHIGFANAVFSMRVLHFAKLLGARFSREEQDSVMDVYRYVGYLFGIPDALLFETMKDAKRIFKIGLLCEPPPDEDSAALANALVHAVPRVTSAQSEEEAEELLRLAYSLSRILVGRKLANTFQFPNYNGLFALLSFRGGIFLDNILKGIQVRRSKNFTDLLGISSYDETGISYKLPTHVKDALSQNW